MTLVMGLGLLILILPLFNILGFVAYRGVQSLDWAFFTSKPPLGLGHAILGTLTMVGLAPLFGVPIGIFAALFLSEFRSVALFPWFALSVTFWGPPLPLSLASLLTRSS